jgi:hypothetical protein
MLETGHNHFLPHTFQIMPSVSVLQSEPLLASSNKWAPHYEEEYQKKNKFWKKLTPFFLKHFRLFDQALRSYRSITQCSDLFLHIPAMSRLSLLWISSSHEKINWDFAWLPRCVTTERRKNCLNKLCIFLENKIPHNIPGPLRNGSSVVCTWEVLEDDVMVLSRSATMVTLCRWLLTRKMNRVTLLRKNITTFPQQYAMQFLRTPCHLVNISHARHHGGQK